MPFPDNMDLGEGFRAVCLHLTALSVHPGRKQGSRQAEPGSAEDRPVLVVLVGQGGRNSAEAPQADRLWLRGGGVWSSLVCTVDKGGGPAPNSIPGEFTTYHQDLEIQTGCEQEEELLLADWAPWLGRR